MWSSMLLASLTDASVFLLLHGRLSWRLCISLMAPDLSQAISGVLSADVTLVEAVNFLLDAPYITHEWFEGYPAVRKHRAMMQARYDTSNMSFVRFFHHLRVVRWLSCCHEEASDFATSGLSVFCYTIAAHLKHSELLLILHCLDMPAV